MKKFIALIITLPLVICFFIGERKIFATNENYYRVINETTPFFSDETGESPLFYLPYTYYVNVLEEIGDMLHVEIGTDKTLLIDGYTYKNALFKDEQKVDVPYPEIKVITKSVTVFYADKYLTEEIRYLFKDRTCDYFGKTEINGELIFCVGYGGTLGYVKESAVYPFEIENHPNNLTFLDKNEPEKENPEHLSSGNQAVKLGVIACLFLAGVVGLFFAVKLKRPSLKEDGAEYENE